MKYLLLVCTDGPLETIPEGTDVQGWAEEMTRRGIRETGMRLRPPSDATTVRGRRVPSRSGPRDHRRGAAVPEPPPR
jgi:hypothetical protein